VVKHNKQFKQTLNA